MTSLAFVFAAGEGTYDEQGLYLARSIARTNPDAEIYAFVPEAESPAHEDDLRDLGTVIQGKQTIPDYGISTKIDALAAAEEIADENYLLLLDTDTLVLDEVTAHESGADLYLKPVDVGQQFWGRKSQSEATWRALAGDLALPAPKWSHESTFDHRSIPPYWNAGFVLTRTGDFGRRWMEAVDTIYPDIPYEWHTDQVTLGLLSQECDVETLDNRYNYPLHLRLRAPADLVVLHYHAFANLHKASRYEKFMRDIDLWELVQETDYSYISGVWRYAKRKTLPLNEEHMLERLYNWILN
ncbi:hypothetical protein [Halorhabdus salina]|uniref:hypothetical protein n=1 Tax=Halorhabdus salina TaxID=2750670 RepID=UPI0015EF25E0|nr:hypothetical protein [Halorhabdus salina]